MAGKTHLEFVKADGGKPYAQYKVLLEDALQKAGVRWCRTKDLQAADLDQNDIVFYDTYIDENMLLKLYGATNMMILPYLNMQQISSGILADTAGSGRIAIATKFMYALELIHSNKKCPPGLIVGRYARA